MTKHDKSDYVMIQIHFKKYMTGHNINMIQKAKKLLKL